MTRERERCSSTYSVPGDGRSTYLCTLRPGHGGVHECDPFGIWWPRDDQLETW